MKKTLNKLQRARRVLVSQGKAPVLAESSLSSRLDEIAALCSESGQVSASAASQFERIWHEHVMELNAQKATDSELED